MLNFKKLDYGLTLSAFVEDAKKKSACTARDIRAVTAGYSPEIWQHSKRLRPIELPQCESTEPYLFTLLLKVDEKTL